MTKQVERGFLARIWFGFWAMVDATRRLLVNLIFLLIVVIIIVILVQDKGVAPLESETTLVLQPQGVIREQYTGTAFEQALNAATGNEQPETRLRDLLQAISFAADDKKITQLLIDVRQLQYAGMATLQELETALTGFKRSGKPVYALGAFMDQVQYRLASNADEIWLEKGGLVWLEGLSRYRNYYAEGLDKLAVDINLFRVGEYKSAMEPYIRNDMSEQAKQANLLLLDNLWQGYLESIARQRGLPVSVLSRNINDYAQLIDTSDGDSAEVAITMGLVDKIVTRPQARSLLAQSGHGHSDGEGGFRFVRHANYLQQNQLSIAVGKPKVGVIVAEGEIVSGTAPSGMAGDAELVSLLREARRDDAIKAVVLRINSPGGDAFASEVIRQEMLQLQDSKPVVVSMGDVAASGGYWIAMGAAEIWADAATITGSIGIFGVFPTFQDSLAKLGIYTDGVGTTPQAGALRIDRKLSPAVRQTLQSLINDGYNDFLQLVSENRNMQYEQTNSLARGRVWSGKQAHSRDLIDQLGGLQAASQAAARRADIEDDFELSYVQQPLSGWQRLITDILATAVVNFDIELPDSLLQAPGWLPQSIEQQLRAQLEPLLRSYQRPTLLAHCLCVSP